MSAFEQYKFSSLKFTFESATSTSERGSIIMLTNVDAKDNKMTTFAQLLSYSQAVNGRIWDTHTHIVPSQAMVKRSYVRPDGSSEKGDLSLYDIGVFYIATMGVQPNINVGTLWVEYEIEFYTPKASPIPHTLHILGDTMTVNKAEPLGDEKKWKVDDSSTIKWHCPENADYCEFVFQPNGDDSIDINLVTQATLDAKEEKYYPPKDIVGENINFITDIVTEGVNFVENAMKRMASIQAFGEIIDPTKPAKFRLALEDFPALHNVGPQLKATTYKRNFAALYG